MKFKLPTSKPRAAKRTCAAFTLAEVLVALLLLAVLIPVAVDGVRVASLAGEVGVRKATAARIAERMLNELVVTRQWTQAFQNGTVQEGTREYRWLARVGPWSESPFSFITVQVTYPVRGRDYEVHLSTLVDTTVQ
jgi:prepilin-type N-terminal cleavage/methylation domain-containing protein